MSRSLIHIPILEETEERGETGKEIRGGGGGIAWLYNATEAVHSVTGHVCLELTPARSRFICASVTAIEATREA